MADERVLTGIDGLDALIDGGLLEGSVTVVSGDAGTGKTMICSQFLWEGYDNDETCLYVSTEEMPDEILHDAAEFGWEFDEDSDRFHIEYLDPSTRSNYFRKDVKRMVEEEMDPDRIVIDSISVLSQYWDDDANVRTNLTQLIKLLKDWETTVLITAEAPDGESRHDIVEFVADGVINLDAKSMGSGLQRTLTVKKMRGTAMDGSINDLKFTEDGLVVGE